MSIDKPNKNQINRRRAFRIYEQVDLFYQKISPDQSNEAFPHLSHAVTQSQTENNSSSADDSAFNRQLPESHSQENDTKKVSISSSGISFTSKEELMAGDNLMIRVLLLSNMVRITTCCKVVYCNPSNPFESDLYPYQIGAHFVNLRPEEKTLLDNYVSKKRLRKIIVNSLITCFILIGLAFPEFIFDALLDQCFFLIDSILDMVGLMLDIISYSSDEAVEYFFHTELHETQIISFYIQLFLATIGVYLSFRVIRSILKSLFYRFRVFLYRKKWSLLYYWRGKTMLYKIAMISLAVFAILCYGMFFI